MRYEVSMYLHQSGDKALIEHKTFYNARKAIECFDAMDVAKEWAFHCLGADIADLMDKEVRVCAAIVKNGTCVEYKWFDTNSYLTGERG